MSFKRIFIFGSLAFAMGAYSMDDQQLITLQTLDKEKFKVEVGVAKLSETLKNLLQDAEIDIPLDLPNMRGATLAIILELLKIIKTDGDTEATQKTIVAELSRLPGAALIDVIAAANFLDITTIFNLALKVAQERPIAQLPPSLLELPKQVRNAILYAQAQNVLGPELITQSIVLTLPSNNRFIANVARNGERMVVRFSDSLSLYDIHDMKNIKQLATLEGIFSVCSITSDGSKILAKTWGDQRILILDGNTLKELHAFNVPVLYNLLGLSSAGSLIAAGRDDTIFIWDSEGPMRAEFTLNKAQKDLGLEGLKSSFGALLSFEVTLDNTLITICSLGVILWDLRTFKAIALFHTTNEYIEGGRLSPDQRKVIFGSVIDNPMITIIDLRTKEKSSFRTNAVMHAVAVSPDYNKILGAHNKTIYIWDVKGKELQRLIGHAKHITSIDVTPDNSYVISVSEDNTIRIWDIAQVALHFKNMSSEQAQQIFNYLQGNHADGWEGIQAIFGLATTPLDVSGAESETKKRKKE